MKPLFYELIKKRDVLILKVLLEDVLKRAKAMEDLEAFLSILAYINYQQNNCRIKDKEKISQRGEAMSWNWLFLANKIFCIQQ